MSTFQNNKTIRVSGGGTFQGTSGSFVVPANSYARFYAAGSATTPVGSSGSLNISVGTVSLFSASLNGSSASYLFENGFAPAGTTVSYSAVNSGTVKTIWVIFSNSP